MYWTCDTDQVNNGIGDGPQPGHRHGKHPNRVRYAAHAVGVLVTRCLVPTTLDILSSPGPAQKSGAGHGTLRSTQGAHRARRAAAALQANIDASDSRVDYLTGDRDQ